MKATLALFVVGLAVASAGEEPDWLTQENVIDDPMAEFQAAAERNDTARMAQLTSNLLTLLQDVKKRTKKYLSVFEEITGALRAKSDAMDHSSLSEIIEQLDDTDASDYTEYTFDDCRFWIEAREGSITDPDIKVIYTDAKNKMVQAGNAFDGQFDVFFEHFKNIEELIMSETRTAEEIAKEISDSVSAMEKANNGSQVDFLTKEALEMVEALTNLK